MGKYGAMRICQNPVFGVHIAWIDTADKNWMDNETTRRRVESYEKLGIVEASKWGINGAGKCIFQDDLGSTIFAESNRLDTVVHELYHAVNYTLTYAGVEEVGGMELTAYMMSWVVEELLGDYKFTPEQEDCVEEAMENT